MKTLKNYSLVLIAIVFSSTLSYGQIVLATVKKKKEKEEVKVKEVEADTTTTKEEEKTFTLSGSIDTYFHKSLGTKEMAPGTSFANLKGFSLGMVNLIAAYQGEKSGFVADLVLGPRGYDAVFGSATWSFPGGSPTNNGQRIINQMYAYVKLGKAVTVNLGQFNTFVGYETITPVPNFHYSCSYLFTNGPFNHTGLRADFDLGGGFVGKLAIMNPTDIVEFNPVSTYTGGLQFGYANDDGSIYLNALYGDPDGKDKDYEDPTANIFDKLFQIDLTTGWTLSDMFYIGANASMRSIAMKAGGDDAQFMGIALYPKLTLSESFALGLRAEHFVAKGGYGVVAPFTLVNGKGNVTEFTLSGNYTVGSLRIIPEVRIDAMSENSYTKDNDAATPTKTMTSVNLAAVYKF
jgi:hypothetical protein